MNIFPKIADLSKRLSPSKKTAVKTEIFDIPNKHKAKLVFPSPTDNAEDIISALNLKPYKAVFLNLGNADNFDDRLQSRLIQLFSRGIANAALNADALIIDGGLPAGVMELIGKGVADRGNKSMLLGIAPAYKVTFDNDVVSMITLETNHSHFILTEGSRWETDPMVSDILSQLVNRPEKSGDKIVMQKVPALATLTGGNDSTKNTLLEAVRQKFTIIVVAGSSGLADEIIAAFEKKDTPPEDPAMAEIIADGKLFFYSLNSPINEIQKLIVSALGVDQVLMQAWETFADYDLNANRKQKTFDVLQQLIIGVGILGTGLAIIREVMKDFFTTNPDYNLNFLGNILIIIPILLTVLITITNRFKQGNKWLLLRAAAESIKREIFRYRTSTNEYSSNPAQQLSKKIEDITTRIMRTEVNTSYLSPYDKSNGFPPYMYAAQGGDDGFSNLSAERYITIRLNDQLNYFRMRSVRLGKQLTVLLYVTFLVGGIGTYLAAVGQTIWIAFTTTIVSALGTYLGYRQTENTLTKYNQTATNLTNIKGWWNALSPADQSKQENVNSLVDHTEQVLQVELDGWIQQMQNVLAELRKNQEAKAEKEEDKTPEQKSHEDGTDHTNNKPAAKPDLPDNNNTSNPAVDTRINTVSAPTPPLVKSEAAPA